MYSGRQKTLSLLSLQHIALAFGVALFILILFLAGQSAFRRAQGTAPGLAHGLTHGADREINDGGEGQGLAAGTASQGGNSLPPSTYRTPSIVPIVPTQFGEIAQPVFVNEGEKEAARESLAPLHVLVDNIRRFDSTVWNDTSSGGIPVGADGQGGTSAKQDPSLVLEGLDAKASLLAHPLLYPQPLQNDVMDATSELRTYLATVRCEGAGLQKHSGSDLAQNTAHSHLENGVRLLSRLDAMVGGVSSASTLPDATSGLP